MKLGLLFCILASFFLFVQPLSAQEPGEGDFLLNIVPENPQAGGRVTATIQSYSVDINELLVSWSYDGRIMDSGIGKRSVSVQAGALGERKTLEATIHVGNTTIIRKSVIVAPANIDLLWESLDASVPLFYKGKPLVPSEGIVRVSAFPNRASEGRLSIYEWSKNGSPLEQGSGYGKIGFIYKNNYLDTADNIEVNIRQNNGTITEGAIPVAVVRPSFVFYRKTTGFVDYATAITGNYSMQSDIETFIVEPLYFSVLKPIEQVLDIAWTLGGQNANMGDRINELVVSRGTKEGSTRVTVSGKNQKLLTQFFEQSFLLNF